MTQQRKPKKKSWSKRIGDVASSAEELLKGLETAKRVCALVLLALVVIAGTPYYLSLRPKIDVRVAGDKEIQPISIGWGQHHILLSIENESTSPIRIKELSVGFTPTENFTLVPSTGFNAVLRREERHNSEFSIEYTSVPFPSKGQDLETSIIYEAAKSTVPFRFTVHVTAELDEVEWRRYSRLLADWIPIPSRHIEKSFEYRPEGRKSPLTIWSAHKNKRFEIFGPKLSIPSHITTNNPAFNDITCYGVDGAGKVQIQKFTPLYAPACKP